MSVDVLLAALQAQHPQEKCEAVARLDADCAAALAAPRQPPAIRPGRPERPRLIHPRDVPNRGLGSVQGRVALAHAVAHIEFNAINLALDACLRFAGMPEDYYRDWISVAQDEARHFGLLNLRLQQLGSAYGELPAHDGLWEAAEKTAHDVLARMALVPRVLEARGLDVTPGMILRLQEVGDGETAAVLRVILDEEVRHVALGTQWYRWLCAQRGLDADAMFPQLLAEYGARLRAPLNWPAREAAGFNQQELAPLLL